MHARVRRWLAAAALPLTGVRPAFCNLFGISAALLCDAVVGLPAPSSHKEHGHRGGHGQPSPSGRNNGRASGGQAGGATPGKGGGGSTAKAAAAAKKINKADVKASKGGKPTATQPSVSEAKGRSSKGAKATTVVKPAAKPRKGERKGYHKQVGAEDDDEEDEEEVQKANHGAARGSGPRASAFEIDMD